MKTLQTGPVFYVYEHWRPDKDVCFYVGKGYGGRAQRIRRKRNRHHCSVVAKLGRLGMCVEVRMVQSGMTERDAHVLEIERIAFWRDAGAKIANLTVGGEGVVGHKHSDETRAIIKEKRRAQKIVHSEETIQKLRIAHKGRGAGIKNPAHSVRMKGRPLTAEHRAAIAAGSLGRVHSDVTKEKISKRHSGRVHSDVSRENMRKAHIGKKPSDETRQKMSESQARRWAAIKES